MSQASAESLRLAERASLWWSRESARFAANGGTFARLLRWCYARPMPILVGFGAISGALLDSVAASYDSGEFRRIAVEMLAGDFFMVFADPWVQVGPLLLVFVGLLTLAAQLVGLPASVVVGGAQGALLFWLLLLTVRRAMRRDPTRVVQVQWAVAAVVLVSGSFARAFLSGHPEEIAIGLLLAYAALRAAEGSVGLVGALIALASGMKAWGVLGGSIVVVGRRWRWAVRRALLAAGLFALCYLPFMLWGEVQTFGLAWDVNNPVTAWLFGDDGAGWGLRAFQAACAVACGALVALRRSGSPLVVVLVTMCVRLALDPLALRYYLGPVLCVLVVWVWTSGAISGVWRMTGWSGVVVLLHWSCELLPWRVWTSLWSIGMLALVVVVLLTERAARPVEIAVPAPRHDDDRVR